MLLIQQTTMVLDMYMHHSIYTAIAGVLRMNIEVITADGIAGDSIATLARSRLRLALSLTAIMIAIYFGLLQPIRHLPARN
jgi:hypothetical protein